MGRENLEQEFTLHAVAVRVGYGAKPVGAGDLCGRLLSGRKRTIPFDASAVPYAPIPAIRGTVDRPAQADSKRAYVSAT